MELKILLDFDGVLFNSAFEAFTVSNEATPGATASARRSRSRSFWSSAPM